MSRSHVRTVVLSGLMVGLVGLLGGCGIKGPARPPLPPTPPPTADNPTPAGAGRGPFKPAAPPPDAGIL